MIQFDSFMQAEGVPIYQQIIRYVKQGIAAGTIRDGEELPSRRVLSALAIGHGLRYGNPGFAEPIPELGLRPVAETESAAVNSVLSNSFGFGGNCSSLIFAK